MNAPLTPVDFGKGRIFEQRSKPRIPGRHAESYWSEPEDEIVRTYYPTGGWASCKTHLPNRSRSAIFGRAHQFGLHAPKGGRHHRVAAPDNLDDILSERWPLLEPKRGAVDALAAELNLPDWYVSKRAAKLGLAKPWKKEKPWTAAEEALLRRVPLHDLVLSSKIFREHGFNRTPAGISVRCKRLKVSRRATHEGFSATAAARLLGFNNKTVTQWCISGELPAKRRNDYRLSQQGGSVWEVSREDLRRFVIDNLERIDFRKVEKFALVDLLVRQHRPRNIYEMG